jgi:hypothetical protein
MKKTIILAALLLVTSLCAAPVAAQAPPIPHAFYGTVEINGDPAPIGTTVEARGEGVVIGEGNPITVTEAGKYGGPNPSEPKLVVQGDIDEGTTLTFYVDGEAAEQTAEWHSMGITELDLSVTISIPTEDGVDEVPQDINAPKISDVSLCPVGVTTATICWTTDEASTSQVEYWDGDRTQSPLDEVLVTEHTVQLSGLTPDTTYSYRVMSRDEAGNHKISDTFTFTTMVESEPTPTTTPPESVIPPSAPPEGGTPINWALIGGIIAGVVIVGLIIFFLVRRRAY